MTRPELIAVAYYTQGTPYAAEAARLTQSLLAAKLDHHVEAIPNLGSWSANTGFKPMFLKKMFALYGDRRLVYIDVDAVVHRYPSLLDEIHCDIAVHFTPHNPLSGTIYLEPTEAARALLDAWIEAVHARPNTWDQKLLGQSIVVISKSHRLRTFTLPAEYTFVFDWMRRMYPAADPVIEHFQASRRLRDKVGLPPVQSPESRVQCPPEAPA